MKMKKIFRIVLFLIIISTQFSLAKDKWAKVKTLSKPGDYISFRLKVDSKMTRVDKQANKDGLLDLGKLLYGEYLFYITRDSVIDFQSGGIHKIDQSEVTLHLESGSNDSLEQEAFIVVEEMPEFPGGEVAMRNYISQSLIYPEKAQEWGIQGKVIVTFIIDIDGSIKDAKISKRVHPKLDEEALRLINNMPKWKPGRQKGKPVRVNYTVPISFILG
jgi:TonB family protein